jgi:hypothetical protein
MGGEPIERLCRQYFRIDPAATAAYVAAYDQIRGSDAGQPP